MESFSDIIHYLIVVGGDMMIIISGPSTIGKNPLIYKICNEYNFEFVIPSTTRQIRKEEINGRDYEFLCLSDFQQRIKDGTITEWDYVLGNYYGYSFNFPGNNSMITHGLSRMAIRIKNKYPNDITTNFLMPSNIDRIYGVLGQIYSGEILEARRALVKEEIIHSSMFDMLLTVGDSVFDVLNDHRIKALL